MKKQFITRGFNDGKSPRIINLEIVDGDCGFTHLELHCDFSEVEALLNKALADLKTVGDFNVLLYKKKNKSEIKNVPSYSHEHINLRYHLAKKYKPHDLLDSFEKIEHDLSDIYDKFRKSLKPPFDSVLKD